MFSQKGLQVLLFVLALALVMSGPAYATESGSASGHIQLTQAPTGHQPWQTASGTASGINSSDRLFKGGESGAGCGPCPCGQCDQGLLGRTDCQPSIPSCKGGTCGSPGCPYRK